MAFSKGGYKELNDKIHKSHVLALMGRGVTGSNPEDGDRQRKQKKHTQVETLTPARRKIEKTPKPPDRGMEFLHEKRDYNVAEFFEHFHNDLPKTVMVNQGFCGEIVEDTFDREQVVNKLSEC